MTEENMQQEMVNENVQEQAQDQMVQESEVQEQPQEQSMEQLLEESSVQDIHRGKIVEGIVVEANEDGWLVDVGYKCEGFLPRREWSHRVLVEEAEEPNVGDTVQVQVINVGQGEEAQLVVSRWRSEFDTRWAKLEEMLEGNEKFAVKGLRKVKGGLIVDCCGIEGFVPISHLAEEGRGVNPGRFVEEDLEVRLIEKDRRKRRLVLSHRAVLEEEMVGKREEFYENVTEGAVVEGTVSSITSFGVFVNLGAVEGLVHISELSWQRNSRPKEIVAKGDTVKVKVIGMDHDQNRISLSMKQTMDDPWFTVSERWNSGDVAEGTVTNLTDFGAFVEIEAGVEGLVHIGDISWSRIKHPKEVFKKGQHVEVQILDIDPEKRRISLGYKQLHDPWKGIEERYTPKQDVEVKVVRLADFGAFVQLEEGVEGLIHISQLSRQRVEKPGDVLQEGQEVTARILEVNSEGRRIRLSISALQPAPAEEGAGAPRKPREAGGEPRKRRRQGGSDKASIQQFAQEETNVTLGDLWKDVLNS